MTDFFILQGRRSLVREALGAWLSLTLGVVLFTVVAVRCTPTIGQNASYGAGLIVAAPLAVTLLQSVRTGRFKFPSLPTIPKGITKAEVDKRAAEGFLPLLKSLDPETRQGLQLLAGLIAASTFNRESFVELSEAERSKILTALLDDPRLMQGPEEFTIRVPGNESIVIHVNMDRKTHEVTMTRVAAKDSSAAG